MTRSLRTRHCGLLALALASACHDDVAPGDATAAPTATESGDTVVTETSGQTSTSDAMSTDEGTSSEPFDLLPWVGRYHFEDPFHPFGQSNEVQGSTLLANFEVFPDFTAAMFVDQCSLDEPIQIAYVVVPETPTTLRLLPGDGEPSLRFKGLTDLDDLRVMMIDPCRELTFEYDGMPEPEGWGSWHPGEACWVDRCETSDLVFHIDYCEGEEPPACP